MNLVMYCKALNTHKATQYSSKRLFQVKQHSHSKQVTCNFSGVEQYLRNRCANQYAAAGALDDGDHVEGDLTGATSRVRGAVEHVIQQRRVTGEAALTRRRTCACANDCVLYSITSLNSGKHSHAVYERVMT